jgi:hypothetical protein
VHHFRRQVHEKEEEEEGKLTGGLVGRKGGPEVEIDAAALRRAASSGLGRRLRCARAGSGRRKVREEVRLEIAFYRWRWEEEEAARQCSTMGRPLMARASVCGGSGEGKGPRRRWVSGAV